MAPEYDTCSVVPLHLTVELAHHILHIHRSCPTEQCPRRKAALYYLMDTRRVTTRRAGLPGSARRTGLG
ncbi:hypothetical protein [Nocardia aurantia]|uniref:Uncharacterized protein n=1 Tax=Nocardia aurantia TaxID=2585199 RepID=A0A7K0DIQ9_9NOCA|nr:hypothetical protein [Nocardia aurantia]MQY24654.1 hypothetical protein [Nocardia aurantia]